MIFVLAERNQGEVYIVGCIKLIHYIVLYPVHYSFTYLLSALLVVCPIFIQQRGWTLTLVGSKHLCFTRDMVPEISEIR